MEVFARTGGAAPKDRHKARQDYRLQDLSRIAGHSGLDFNLHPEFWPTDPLPASLAIIDAVNRDAGDAGLLCRCILRACWAEDRNIAEPDVVDDCLAGAGIATGGTSGGIDDLKRQFAANTEEAVARNVFGSPTYAVGDQLFWGQDRLDYLESWLG